MRETIEAGGSQRMENCADVDGDACNVLRDGYSASDFFYSLAVLCDASGEVK